MLTISVFAAHIDACLFLEQKYVTWFYIAKVKHTSLQVKKRVKTKLKFQVYAQISLNNNIQDKMHKKKWGVSNMFFPSPTEA